MVAAMRRMTTIVLCVLLMTSVMTTFGAVSATTGLPGDTDGDGLSDMAEFLHGTDPLNPDSDAGGAPDGWEVYYDTAANRAVDTLGQGIIDSDYHFNPTLRADDGAGKFDPAHLILVRSVNPQVWLDDPDGDSAVNGQEFLMGTDPTNPDTDGDGMSDTNDPDPLTSNDSPPLECMEDNPSDCEPEADCLGPNCPDIPAEPCSGPDCPTQPCVGSECEPCEGSGCEDPEPCGSGNCDDPEDPVEPVDPIDPEQCGNGNCPTDPDEELPETRVVLDSSLPQTVAKGQALPLKVHVEVDYGFGWEPLDSVMTLRVYVVYPELGNEEYLAAQGSNDDIETGVLYGNLQVIVPGGAPAGHAGLKVLALGNEFAAPSEATFGL